MLKTRSQIAFVAVLTARLTCAGASPSIGIAFKNSDFQVDSSRVRGTATLFDGNVIDTRRSPVRLYLHNGAQLRLAAESKAAVFSDRLQLRSGAGGLTGGSYRLEALSLRIAGDSPQSSAAVSLARRGVVHVSALQGNLAVSNREGVQIARVQEGGTLEMSPADAAGLTRITGAVRKSGQSCTLDDQVAGVSFELRGEKLDCPHAKKAAVSGTVRPEKGSSGNQILRVSSIQILSPAVIAAAAGGAATGAEWASPQ